MCIVVSSSCLWTGIIASHSILFELFVPSESNLWSTVHEQCSLHSLSLFFYIIHLNWYILTCKTCWPILYTYFFWNNLVWCWPRYVDPLCWGLCCTLALGCFCWRMIRSAQLLILDKNWKRYEQAGCLCLNQSQVTNCGCWQKIGRQVRDKTYSLNHWSISSLNCKSKLTFCP